MTDDPQVHSDGSGDSTAGLQGMIDRGARERRPVYFPSGSYRVTASLRCYLWRSWNAGTGRAANPSYRNHMLVGASVGARPVIRLAVGAAGFDDPDAPRPVVTFNCWEATDAQGTSTSYTGHPFENPPHYGDDATTLFACSFRNIDIDTGGNAGAVGLYFTGAQHCDVANVRVDATGSLVGVWGLAGRAGRRSCTYNILCTLEWIHPDYPAHPRTLLTVSASGGGRHYFFQDQFMRTHMGNRDCRPVKVVGTSTGGTSTPLWFYGLNIETGMQDGAIPDAGIEVVGAQNIRIFNVEREGRSPTLIARNSRNVGLFGSGAMSFQVAAGRGGHIQFLDEAGTQQCNDNVAAMVLARQVSGAGEPMIREIFATVSRTVDYPTGVSLHRRGALDDEAMHL